MEGLQLSIETYLKTNSPLVFIFVFAAGFLSSLTPCVYPMIPITIAYIGGKSTESKMKGLILSIFYVLGLALCYSVLGIFAALTGSIFGQVASNPYTYLVLGNIFMALGLNMLGVFEIPIQSFLMNISSGKKKGILGSFIMGIILGIVAAPCTGPILALILTFVAAKQNVVFSITTLFIYSLGMGMLFLILGTFSGLLTSMPKSGAWMDVIKKLFGFLILIISEYFFCKWGQLSF
ncbi:sulfite exporter TauE/SafE family protein [bacterium]|nr:sulfite exporter TauE/SafE family protein [bacterium]